MRRLFTLFLLFTTLSGWAANPSYEDFWTNHFIRVGNQLRVRTNVIVIGTNISLFTDQVFTNDGTNIRVVNKLLNRFLILSPTNVTAAGSGIIITNKLPRISLVETNGGNQWDWTVTTLGANKYKRSSDNYSWTFNTNGQIDIIGVRLPTSPILLNLRTNDDPTFAFPPVFQIDQGGDIILLNRVQMSFPTTNGLNNSSLQGWASTNGSNFFWTSLLFQPASTNLSNWANISTNVLTNIVGGAQVWTNNGQFIYPATTTISNTAPVFFRDSDGSIFVGSNVWVDVNVTDTAKVFPIYYTGFTESNQAAQYVFNFQAVNNENYDFFSAVGGNGTADKDNPLANFSLTAKNTNGDQRTLILTTSTNDPVFRYDKTGNILFKYDPNLVDAADSITFLVDAINATPSATNALAFRTKGTNRLAIAGDAVFPNDATQFLNGQGRWSMPAATNFFFTTNNFFIVASNTFLTNGAIVGAETNFNMVAGLGIQLLATNVAGTNNVQIKVDGHLTNWVNLPTNVILVINPTDGFIPVRANSTTFTNSPWQVLSQNTVFISNEVDSAHIILYGTNSHSRITHNTGGQLVISNLTDTGTGTIELRPGNFLYIFQSDVFQPEIANSGRIGQLSQRWTSAFVNNAVVTNVWYGNDTSLRDTFGSGSPEGAVSALVGSTYRRSDGGAGTTLYTKTNGSGTTGWSALGAGSGGGGSDLTTNANQFLGVPLSIKDGVVLTNATNFGVFTFAVDPLGNRYQLTTANDSASLFFTGQQSSFNIHSNGMFSYSIAAVDTNVGFLIYYGGDGQHIFEVQTNGLVRLTSDGNRQYDLSPSDTGLSIYHVGQQASMNIETNGAISISSSTIGTNAGFQLYNGGDGVVFFGVKTNVPGSGDFLALDPNAFVMRTNGVNQAQLNNASNVLRGDIITIQGMSNVYVLRLNGVATNLTTYSGSPSLTVIPVLGMATNIWQVFNTSGVFTVYVTSNDLFTASNTYIKGTLSNETLTASTILSANAGKAVTSVANGTGMLTNNGTGTFGWMAIPASGSGTNWTQTGNTLHVTHWTNTSGNVTIGTNTQISSSMLHIENAYTYDPSGLRPYFIGTIGAIEAIRFETNGNLRFTYPGFTFSEIGVAPQPDGTTNNVLYLPTNAVEGIMFSKRVSDDVNQIQTLGVNPNQVALTSTTINIKDSALTTNFWHYSLLKLTNAPGWATNFMQVQFTNGNNAVYVDSNGVLVATAVDAGGSLAATKVFRGEGDMEMRHNGNPEFRLISGSSLPGQISSFDWYRSRNNVDSPTAVEENDFILEAGAIPYDGDSFQNHASLSIWGKVDGSVSDNNIPGRMEFAVADTSGGTGALKIRQTIKNDGAIYFRTPLFVLTNSIGGGTPVFRIGETNDRAYTQITVTNTGATNTIWLSIGSNTVSAGQALLVHSTTIDAGTNHIVLTNGTVSGGTGTNTLWQSNAVNIGSAGTANSGYGITSIISGAVMSYGVDTTQFPVEALKTNEALVELTGNDGTGRFGDPTKPFATIRAAIAATPNQVNPPWTLLIGAGEFVVPDKFSITVSNGCVLRGKGMFATTISGSNTINQQGPLVNPRDNAQFYDLTIDQKATNLLAAPFGTYYNAPSNSYPGTNIYLNRVRLLGKSDCLYSVVTNMTSGTFDDCWLDGGGRSWDIWTIAGHTNCVWTANNCIMTTRGLNPINGQARIGNLFEGTNVFNNCTLIATDGNDGIDPGTVGFQMHNGISSGNPKGQLELNDCILYTASKTGSVTDIVNTVSATVIVRGLFDTNKSVGPITVVPDYAYIRNKFGPGAFADIGVTNISINGVDQAIQANSSLQPIIGLNFINGENTTVTNLTSRGVVTIGISSTASGGGGGALTLQTNLAVVGEATNLTVTPGVGITLLATNVSGTNMLGIGTSLGLQQLTNVATTVNNATRGDVLAWNDSTLRWTTNNRIAMSVFDTYQGIVPANYYTNDFESGAHPDEWQEGGLGDHPLVWNHTPALQGTNSIFITNDTVNYTSTLSYFAPVTNREWFITFLFSVSAIPSSGSQEIVMVFDDQNNEMFDIDVNSSGVLQMFGPSISSQSLGKVVVGQTNRIWYHVKITPGGVKECSAAYRQNILEPPYDEPLFGTNYAHFTGGTVGSSIVGLKRLQFGEVVTAVGITYDEVKVSGVRIGDPARPKFAVTGTNAASRLGQSTFVMDDGPTIRNLTLSNETTISYLGTNALMRVGAGGIITTGIVGNGLTLSADGTLSDNLAGNGTTGSGAVVLSNAPSVTALKMLTSANFDGGTASRFLALDAGKNLTNSAPSADLRSTLTDEEGTGPAMFTRTGPYRTVWFSAGSMVPQLTGGATFDTSESYSPTNRMVDSMLFSDATTNRVQWNYAMPLEWDLSTVKFKFFYSSTNASATATNVWAIDATAFSNDDPLTADWGTTVTVTNKITAADDLQITVATAAVTISGTPATGDIVWFRVGRLGAHAHDVDTGLSKLLGVMMQYKESTTEPSQW